MQSHHVNMITWCVMGLKRAHVQSSKGAKFIHPPMLHRQVFWRGFFLASLTKVLPFPACIAASSFNFAALHLSPHNFLPLLLLSAACDALYLRTHNLLLPMMLHCLWNTGQLLAIAFLGKLDFV